MRLTPSILGAATFAVLSMFYGVAHAIPISGILNATGSLVESNGVITFTNSGPIGGGIFAVDPSSTGFWASLAGTSATVQPLSAAIEPPGFPVNIPNWITFNGVPTISVTLNLVLPGIHSAAACGAAPAAGQNCTPPGTPFNLTNLTASSSVESFGLQGTVVDTSSPGETSSFSGLFTVQFPSLSYQSLLASLGGGASVPTTYSAAFTATPNPVISTPEPSTLSLIGFGGAVLSAGLLIKRTLRKSILR
jgi:hypothetical protein